MNLGMYGGKITSVTDTSPGSFLGNTLKLVVTTMLCSWEMQEVSAKVSMTVYILQHTYGQYSGTIEWVQYIPLKLA